MTNRVVITGIGAITPLALNAEDTWQLLLQGQSGIGAITLIDASQLKTKIAAEVKGFEPDAYIHHKDARKMDRFCQFAVAAAAQAIEDAALEPQKIDSNRVGVIVSSGIGGMQTFEDEARKLITKGPQRVSPFFIPMLISDMAAGHISMRYGFHGPNYATASACASSANALVDAMRIIQRSEADVIIAGGAEAAITLLAMAGFSAMKALSTRNDEPRKASRPFDADRDGFVMGEGAGILVLESLDHAENRGAKIYAELAGAGLSADAYHMTAPHPEGLGAQKAIRAALEDAGLQPEDVQYINAHGTSTSANDRIETLAIAKVFGAAADNLNISSSKSMLGHILGASGAIEAIVCALTIRDGVMHPTINQENPDPECFLNYTANEKAEREVTATLSSSFGFGGHNVTLALKANEPHESTVA